MQVADMRILRQLYSATNYIVARSSDKHPTRASSVISFKSLQNPKFSRQIHSSLHLKSSQHFTHRIDASTGWKADSDSVNSPSTSDTTKCRPNVEAFYDPMSGRVRTVRAISENGNNESNENSGNDLSNFENKDAGGPRVYGEVIGRGKKKGKGTAVWVCSDCGNSSGQWWGSCLACKKVGTMKQFSLGVKSNSVGGKVSGVKVSENLARTWLGKNSADAGPIRLTDVNRGISPLDWRIPLYVGGEYSCSVPNFLMFVINLLVLS